MKNIFRLIVLSFLGLAISLILRPHTAFAKSDTIQINEVYFNSAIDGDPAGEWIELYNTGLTAVNIKNWKIADRNLIKDGKSLIITTDDFILEPGKFVLICRNKAIFDSSEYSFVTPPPTIELVGTPYALNNGGDVIEFYNDAGLVIDEISYGDEKIPYDIEAGKKGESLERKDLGIDTDSAADFILRDSPTPGSFPLKAVFFDTIKISEIVPEPDSCDVGVTTDCEFIELFNNSDVSVDISKWKLSDRSGSIHTFTIPPNTILSPKSFIVFKRSVTSIVLNDDGDGIFLIDPNGDHKDEISYDSAIRGESYSKFGSSWQWTEKQTPGLENELVQSVVLVDEEMGGGISESINEAKQYQNGEDVALVGIVTTLPGEISSQYFFIQDETGGIEVYAYYKNFPKLNRGDKIKVIGELSDYYGTRRIKISAATDIEIISPNPMPPPIEVKISEIGEQYESRYLKVKGKISYTSGSVFRMTEGGREIQVEIKSGTGIKKPKMRRGDIVEIAGILIQYKTSYKLLPFLQDDVKIIQSNSGKLPESGSNQSIYLIITTFLYLLWNLPQIARSKLKNTDQNLPLI